MCKVPYDGVNNLTAGVFIDSLSRSLASTVKDANKVKCEGCDEENATMHCADCGQNMGPSCLHAHSKWKMTSSHQLIPLHDALKGKVEVKRVPYCQKHVGFEIDSYCNTCTEAVCAKCGIEKHSSHTFCPLSQVTEPLQDQIAGYSVSMGKREEEARKTITSLDGTLTLMGRDRQAVEQEIAAVFSSLQSDLDVRHAQVIDEIDVHWKRIIKDKEEAESATVEFREFRSFTEGLLAQGTPVEIAGTHKMVRVLSCWYLILDVVVHLSLPNLL